MTTRTNSAGLETDYSLAPASKYEMQFSLICTIRGRTKSPQPLQVLIRLQMDQAKPFFFFFCQSRLCVRLYVCVYTVATVTAVIRRPVCPQVSGSFAWLAQPNPVSFLFRGCLLLVCHRTCCVTLIKDLKGQEAFRERSPTESGWNCEAPWGSPQGQKSSQQSLFIETQDYNKVATVNR